MSDSKRDRPTLFAVGVALTAAQAVLVILLVGAGFLASALGLSIGAFAAEGEAWIPLAAIGGGLALLFAALLFVNVALLYVCWQAWEGGSGWIIALTPSTHSRLKMFEPITFPTARSVLPR